MKRISIAFTLILALVSMYIMPVSTQAAAPNPTKGIAVNGKTDAGAVLAGTLDITRFAVQNGQIVAVGNLTGTLTDAAGVVTNLASTVVNIPVTNKRGTCEILHLELGPVDLNLLGLVVHLDKIVLDITAESGSGNLLGNLLCAVAKLLDSNAAPNAIVNLLNKILGLLG